MTKHWSKLKRQPHPLGHPGSQPCLSLSTAPHPTPALMHLPSDQPELCCSRTTAFLRYSFLFSPCLCSLLYSNPPLQNFLLILQGTPDTTFSEEPVCSLHPQPPVPVRAPNSLRYTHRVLHISLVKDLLYTIVQDIVINFSSARPSL